MKRRARNPLPAVGAFQRWVHNQIEVDHRVFKVKHNHLQKNMFLNSCSSATLPIKITRGERCSFNIFFWCDVGVVPVSGLPFLAAGIVGFVAGRSLQCKERRFLK
jgi:hypothetical protein